MSSVHYIPEGWHALQAYLIVDDTRAAIAFYEKAFGAVEPGARITMPDGKIGHAQLRLGDSMLMLADEFPDMGMRSPRSLGGCPVTLAFYVEDAAAVVDRAVAAGAKLLRPVEDQFYGDRSGQVEDPFGYRWSIQTHVEDVPDGEMQRRAKEMFEGGAGDGT